MSEFVSLKGLEAEEIISLIKEGKSSLSEIDNPIHELNLLTKKLILMEAYSNSRLYNRIGTYKELVDHFVEQPRFLADLLVPDEQIQKICVKYNPSYLYDTRLPVKILPSVRKWAFETDVIKDISIDKLGELSRDEQLHILNTRKITEWEKYQHLIASDVLDEIITMFNGVEFLPNNIKYINHVYIISFLLETIEYLNE